MATSYERRLLAAADLVLSADAQGQGACLPELGVTADLKPHQLDGVAWLIRRYRLGVNVVLGDEVSFCLLCRPGVRSRAQSVYTLICMLLSIIIPYTLFLCQMLDLLLGLHDPPTFG